ncbi:tRNA pseudouridine(55) synthase TruB [Rathayibacter sp. YIM 133350]|uniref:tRNA pseudouridine(55) synthase TruB n=1 Tax=Rathayibacter sp. YIM 133350 TaxID=3131992 RepID=UPI00307CE690
MPSRAASGILLVDKPLGITSHDVVSRIRRLAGTRKVGHAGTLDPLATGLLIIGVESSTRLLTYIVGADKEYTATIRLGSSTTTDDAEGQELGRAPAAALERVSESDIRRVMARLTGRIEQVPSAVSAIKVDGKRAYARVRAGEDVQLAGRPVTVSTFELGEIRSTGGYLDAEVRVECSSGTYIRALARDLGMGLGVGGHLTALRRTRVGVFRIEDAAALDTLDVDARRLNPAEAAGRLFPVYRLDAQQAVDLGHGKRVLASVPQPEGPVAAIAPEGRLVGLVEFTGTEGRSIVNFPPDAPDAEPAP